MKLSRLVLGSLVFTASVTSASAGRGGGRDKRGKSGKSTKSSKSYSSYSSKSSKSYYRPSRPYRMDFDTCVMANPAIYQARELLDLDQNGDIISDKLGPHIGHAELVNEIYGAAVKKWSEGKVDVRDIYDKGETVGEVHAFLADLVDEDEIVELICALTSTLVMQMEETCYYDRLKPAYKIVSMALMNGFSTGVGYSDFRVQDDCFGRNNLFD